MPKTRRRLQQCLNVEVDGKTVQLAPRENQVYCVLQERDAAPISPEVLEMAVTGELLDGTRGRWGIVMVHRLKRPLTGTGLDAQQYIRDEYARGYV